VVRGLLDVLVDVAGGDDHVQQGRMVLARKALLAGRPVGASGLDVRGEGLHQFLGLALQRAPVAQGEFVHPEALGDSLVEALDGVPGAQQGVDVGQKRSILQSVAHLVHHQVGHGDPLGVGAVCARQAQGGPLHADGGVSFDELVHRARDALGQFPGLVDSVLGQAQFGFHGCCHDVVSFPSRKKRSARPARAGSTPRRVATARASECLGTPSSGTRRYSMWLSISRIRWSRSVPAA